MLPLVSFNSPSRPERSKPPVQQAQGEEEEAAAAGAALHPRRKRSLEGGKLGNFPLSYSRTLVASPLVRESKNEMAVTRQRGLLA